MQSRKKQTKQNNNNKTGHRSAGHSLANALLQRRFQICLRLTIHDYKAELFSPLLLLMSHRASISHVSLLTAKQSASGTSMLTQVAFE